MLAVFAHTGGLTGAEVAVAGGTSAVGQKLLEALFGDQAVRTLAATAREDLLRARAGAARAPSRSASSALLDAAARARTRSSGSTARVDALERAR